MDFAQEEANLVYEERLGGSKSPDPHEDSDEEDRQRELEEMLYSRVYYDDTSIKAASPEAVTSPPATAVINSVEVKTVARQLGFASSGIDEPTTSIGSLQVQAGCNRSQFNHPNRFKASRYYDNDGNKNSKLTFVAPSNPSLKYNVKSSLEDQSFTRPSEFTTRLMARSANERSYGPKVTKSVNVTTVKEGSTITSAEEDSTITTVTKDSEEVFKDKTSLPSSPEKALPEVPKHKTVAVDSLEKPSVTRQSPQSCSSSSLETSVDFDHSKECITIDETVQNTWSSISEVASCVEKEKFDSSGVDKCAKITSNSSKLVSPRKRSYNQLSDNSPRTRKLKQQSFEAKVSKVLSSMLDEESRSSIDETPLISLKSNQNLDSPNADPSWSVGMSWADMSSKFSFGVDSIEEESVRSLQLQEDSSNANSRTHTPDLQGRPAEPEKDDESTEPSRYQLQLKVPDMETSTCQSDSESEVGSVVEVVPPVKPPPPVVDLSDGEFVPIIKEKKKSSPNEREITVLSTKQKNTSDSCGNFVIESSSDDDLVILDVIDNSKQNNRNQQRESWGSTKRRSLESSLLQEPVPSKRRTISQRTAETDEQTNEQQLLKDCQVLLDKPIIPKEINNMNRLERWLHNPIRSSKYLDHERFLKNMSDDPKLWRLCSDDIFNRKPSYRGPKCINCNEFGHKTKSCPAPRKVVVCHMCGVPGHSEPRCPKKMCLRCGAKSNIYTDRCKNCISLDPCKVCESRLHEWKSCPDLWRRYHLTTSLGQICKAESSDIRPRNELWCSNCAGKYHLSHECKKAQWKCDSITPFIRSYAEVCDEQQIIEGPTTMTMLITDDCAKLLSTPEGKQFLDELAICRLKIHTSFDVEYKKIVLEGTSLNLQETREKIMEWAQKQKKTLAEKNMQKNIATLQPPPHTCPSLPRQRDSLASVLAHQLQLLEIPGVIDKTVKQLYESAKESTEELSKFTKTKKEAGAILLLKKGLRENRRKCIRFLNMILIGKCGFSGGKIHIDALKTRLHTLKDKNSPEVCGNALYKKIQKHFQPIFGYDMRSDYEQLIHKFYRTNNFVKKFDYQGAGSRNNEPSVSEEVESRNEEPSVSEVSTSPIKQNVRKNVPNAKFNQDLKMTLKAIRWCIQQFISNAMLPVDKSFEIETKLMDCKPFILGTLKNIPENKIVIKLQKQIEALFRKLNKHRKERGDKIDSPYDINELRCLVSKCNVFCRKFGSNAPYSQL